MFVSILLIHALVAPGCSSGPSGPLPVVQGASTSGKGEWDDLNAALSWAVGRHQMAVVESQDESLPGGGVARLYRIRTIRNEPVLVRIDRPEAGSQYDVREVTITARVGRFGDERREKALIKDIRERLEWLIMRWG